MKIENQDLESRIEKDVHRTVLFKIDKITNKVRKSNFLEYENKKKNLSNILKAYGIFDPEVSYCQGMNYIVALLLYYLDSERLAFWVFHQILNKFFWRFIYLNKTPKLFHLLESFKNKVKAEIPQLDKYFEEIEVDYL